MSNPDNPLTRWSRRKSESRAHEPETDGLSNAHVPGVAERSEVTQPSKPEDLPPLDLIGAETDIRAFLGKGVPADLAAAALRRVWSADPAIRDFIGLSENSWDFNAVGGIPGFGSLAPEEIQRLLAQALGESGPEAVTQCGPQSSSDEVAERAQDQSQHPPADSPNLSLDQEEANNAAVIQTALPGGTGVIPPTTLSSDGENVDKEVPQRRRHGSAQPR